jgi:ATP-dependent Clp protease ATP-binding subunit ClpB
VYRESQSAKALTGGAQVIAVNKMIARDPGNAKADNKSVRSGSDRFRDSGRTSGNPQLVPLNIEAKSDSVAEFESKLASRIIGQERAVSAVTSIYQVLQAGLASPNRPIGTMLFLGPTGSGKTRVVEAAAEALFGDPNALIRIDCAEFQHSHEIAKLIGSPPGYLGHRETSPMLTQQRLDAYHTERDPFTLVLFDEIEKASDSLWQLLLGILDKATLTLGDNQRVDFSQTMIFMTSNLGAKEMSEMVSGTLGFAPARGDALREDELDQQLFRTAREAARRKFSPEFMNRIDKIVVFRSLREQQLNRILDLELQAVGKRIDQSLSVGFNFHITDEARRILLAEGTDRRYGARHLKRSIERFLVQPLARLMASNQVRTGDLIVVDGNGQGRGLGFFRNEAESARAEAAIERASAMTMQTDLGLMVA